jgi:hypothetical protein
MKMGRVNMALLYFPIKQKEGENIGPIIKECPAGRVDRKNEGCAGGRWMQDCFFP